LGRSHETRCKGIAALETVAIECPNSAGILYLAMYVK
jgi:hypothetical protein